jgi:hypothetical protein
MTSARTILTILQGAIFVNKHESPGLQYWKDQTQTRHVVTDMLQQKSIISRIFNQFSSKKFFIKSIQDENISLKLITVTFLTFTYLQNKNHKKFHHSDTD